MTETIATTENLTGEVDVVRNDDGTYTVLVDGVDRHPRGDADMAIRALAHYMTGMAYTIKKLQAPDPVSLIDEILPKE